MDDQPPKGIVRIARTSEWCPYCHKEQMVCTKTETVPHFWLPKPHHATEFTWSCPSCSNQKAMGGK
jgi:hypothetical protein